MREIIRRAHREGQTPDGAQSASDLWTRCRRCRQLLYKPEQEQSLWVCRQCKFHFRVSAADRIRITVDNGTFVERDAHPTQVDPLSFEAGNNAYRDKLAQSAASTGQTEVFIYGTGAIDGSSVVVGAIEMDFIGGSMGTVMGEKVARAMETAAAARVPLVLFSSSGGARMQEGAIALMQMAKVLAQLDQLGTLHLPFISVMTDPCYGGVTASYAMMGDVNIAEPGAYIGFAGPRVIEQTTREKLPPGAATAEFLVKHGMIDLVVPRAEMRTTLARLLRLYAPHCENVPDTATHAPEHVEEGRELRVGV